jgi:hypothetical protein
VGSSPILQAPKAMTCQAGGPGLPSKFLDISRSLEETMSTAGYTVKNTFIDLDVPRDDCPQPGPFTNTAPAGLSRLIGKIKKNPNPPIDEGIGVPLTVERAPSPPGLDPPLAPPGILLDDGPPTGSAMSVMSQLSYVSTAGPPTNSVSSVRSVPATPPGVFASQGSDNSALEHMLAATAAVSSI